MLPFRILTSHSNQETYIPIQNFNLIYELCRASKCNTFILYQNRLYGSLEEAAVIHEIYVPFETNTDLVFTIGSIDPNILNAYNEFFIPAEYDWLLLPSHYWDMYKHGDLEANYNPETGQYILVDKSTMIPIDQIILRNYKMVNNYGIMNLIGQVDGYLSSYFYLREPVRFDNMETHPMIRKAYDNKASIGRVLIHLQKDPINVAFYFYKGMFGLNKSDKLSIEIKTDSRDRRLFMATFAPIKKKKLELIGEPLQEIIRCIYVNLI